MNNQKMETNNLLQQLAEESGIIAWHELQRHFARGVVITVAPELDLLQVARAMAADDSTAMSAWLAQGQVSRATDEQAQRWAATQPQLRAVVVAPWVVVQLAGMEALH